MSAADVVTRWWEAVDAREWEAMGATGIAFFTLDDEGRIVRVEDWWPEADQPPPGREDLVERS